MTLTLSLVPMMKRFFTSTHTIVLIGLLANRHCRDFTEKFHQFSAQAKDIDDRTIRLVVGTELAQFHSLTPLTRLSDVGVVKHITNRLQGRITEKYRRVGGLVPRKPTN